MLTFLIPTAHWHFADGLFLLGDRARCKRNSRCTCAVCDVCGRTCTAKAQQWNSINASQLLQL